MKLPRDIKGLELAKKFEKIGYTITRQTGSHIRLTKDSISQHHITIPAHNPLKVGTLSSIITSVSENLGISKAELIHLLFG